MSKFLLIFVVAATVVAAETTTEKTATETGDLVRNSRHVFDKKHDVKSLPSKIVDAATQFASSLGSLTHKNRDVYELVEVQPHYDHRRVTVDRPYEKHSGGSWVGSSGSSGKSRSGKLHGGSSYVQHVPAPVRYVQSSNNYAPAHVHHVKNSISYGSAPVQHVQAPIHYSNPPVNYALAPVPCASAPMPYAPAPVHYAPSPVHYAPPPVHYAPSPTHYAPPPVHHYVPSPVHHYAPSPVHHYAPSPVHYAPPPVHYAPAQMNWVQEHVQPIQTHVEYVPIEHPPQVIETVVERVVEQPHVATVQKGKKRWFKKN